jgi:hypothetical protein
MVGREGAGWCLGDGEVREPHDFLVLISHLGPTGAQCEAREGEGEGGLIHEEVGVAAFEEAWRMGSREKTVRGDTDRHVNLRCRGGPC